MKKIILTVAAMFAFGFANAQEVKFGVKAGLNLSNFTGDVENNSIKAGFQAGGLVEIKVSDKFSVQPEVLYSLQGTKIEEEGTDVNFNMSYLNVPVMAKFYVADGFSLEAGPQIGFLLSANGKAEGVSIDIKDYFKSTDFSLNVGAGYDVAENVNIGARYGFGLSNIAKDSGSEKLHNSNIAIAVAYKF
ncbi:hypothetical protein B6A10_12890 [Flavobacterium sp. L1I52]|uniref:Outer membrane protein beta-barrel domain-containing protein n=1 Tax=Flavobacterium pokkalii TaxID=1940408 RepID=A0ABR7UTV6_9FLAO|nr:porin family protein [Flavobacterium pokkalii]MBD0726072.1 hypothetical protein [Flavobacterium pokkalii]